MKLFICYLWKNQCFVCHSVSLIYFERAASRIMRLGSPLFFFFLSDANNTTCGQNQVAVLNPYHTHRPFKKNTYLKMISSTVARGLSPNIITSISIQRLLRKTLHIPHDGIKSVLYLNHRAEKLLH